MIGSFKSFSILPQNILKKTFLLRPLVCSNNFCSKDEVSDKSIKEQESTVGKKEKLVEDASTIKSELETKSETSDQLKDAAKQKLMSLLSDIKISSKTKYNLNLAKAVKRPSKKERLEKIKANIKSPEDQMNLAVKAVASVFKDDSEKIESELTQKLSTLNNVEEMHAEALKKDTMIDHKMSQNLMSSVEEVAATVTESRIPPRSELTERLLRLSLNEKDSSDKRKSVISIIESMKVKSKGPLSLKKGGHQKREIPLKSQKIEKINLFNFDPLNIFSLTAETKPDSRNILWQKLQEKELRSLTQYAPANAFEEMIMWTEQGKHWKFPIDNETEMGAEENVGFHEHVFLEQHLKGFPTKGPIRHFMELVTVGLSKNPYITVERKIENIEWFRQYFKEKEEILKEYDVL